MSAKKLELMKKFREAKKNNPLVSEKMKKKAGVKGLGKQIEEKKRILAGNMLMVMHGPELNRMERLL